uniref:Transposase n=1 Tax=Acrobeloides nanus TaxID=290746 RepID=A0A914E4E2_9BILA
MSNNEELYRKGIYATKRVKRIHDKLTKQFDHLILDPVFEEVFQRILSCNNLSCGCHNTGSNNLYVEVDPLNAEQSTDKLAITPVDEPPGQVHRGVTAEKVQEFFRRVHEDTMRELNNPVNYQGWDGTNCVRGIKRIVFTAQHGNYTLTGIYCFLVENKIDMRDEFKDTWELLRLRHHWVPLVHRCVTNAYARDHKKRFDEQNYEPIGKAVFLRERLSHILDDWKRAFPDLFQDGSNTLLNTVAIENPDTGPLFKCDICGLKFPKKYAVRCCKNMNRAHFPTTPKNARNNYDAIISRVGVGLKCFSSECSNPILPKEIHPFQTPQERSIILNLLIHTLVNRLEHSPPTASDLEHEDSDDDTQLSTQPSNESSVTASENNDEE